MPPLPADSIHARACKLKCEKILTRPFWPKAKTLAQGNFISPEHVKSLSVSIKITTPDGVVIFMEHRNTIDTSFQTCI